MLPTVLFAGYYKARKFVTGKDHGATMVEYGIMLALIAMVCFAIVASLGTKLNLKFTDLEGKLP
jgi:pilus assembly protein Flp/PilA